MFNKKEKPQNERSNLGVLARKEDKELIKKVADLQRRSVASFILESALIRAREYLEGMEGNIPMNQRSATQT